jgi:hypothetical protein
MKFTRHLIGLLASFLAATHTDAQSVLYGATASNEPGQLVILNKSTGALVSIVGPTNDSLGVNYGITGLTYNPANGLLYGSTANGSNYNAATRANLVTVNPATGLVTVIGAFNVGNTGNLSTMSDLAFFPSGQLYGVGSVGGPNLYHINIATGQAVLVGDTGMTSTSGGGLAINATGSFYGTPTASQFGTYNSSTGAFTNIGTPSAYPAGGGAYNALKFDVNGVLYGLNSGNGTPPPTHIVTFDPTTATVTDNGASINALDAIVFVPVPEPVFALAAFTVIPAVGWMRRRNTPAC